MQDFVEHLISFPNEFNKFNNTEARMQDFIYHMTLISNFAQSVTISPLENATFLWTSTHNITS